MWRIPFLTLILFSSFAFAQIQEKPQAVKFDEFGMEKISLIKQKLDKFNQIIKSQEGVKGYIVIVGIQRERKYLLNQILRYIQGFDNCWTPSRFFVFDGGKDKFLKTTFWIVPPEAEPPIKLNSSTSLN